MLFEDDIPDGVARSIPAAPSKYLCFMTLYIYFHDTYLSVPEGQIVSNRLV